MLCDGVRAGPAGVALVLLQISAKGVIGALPALVIVGALTGAFGYALGQVVGARERKARDSAKPAAPGGANTGAAATAN